MLSKLRLCFWIMLLVNLTFFTTTYGQVPNLAWAKSFGTGFCDPKSITTDASGNVYVVGNFGGTIDFDPGPGTLNLTAIGAWDAFVQKFDGDGNLIWAKSLEVIDGNDGGSSNWCGANSIVVGPSGNVYVTGYFNGIVDFDPGSGTSTLSALEYTAAFVQKLDGNGNFEWVRSMKGNQPCEGRSITIDPSGNLYVVGEFARTVDFDPGPGILNLTSNGAQDFFVQKFDDNGNFEWVRIIGGNGSEVVNSVAVNMLGDVYITGSFARTVDFDPGPGTLNLTANGFRDAFVQKFDGDGNVEWVKSMGEAGSYGTSITAGASGNVYLIVNGSKDFFVQKLDSNGSLLWARSRGGGYSVGRSVTVDASENVYVTGSFSDTVDFGLGSGSWVFTANIDGEDIFVQKLGRNGNLLWAFSMGGGEESYHTGNSITTDAFGSVYVTGYFEDIIDFDPGPGNLNLTGRGSIFVQKLLNPCTATIANSVDTRTACGSLTWIDGNTYYSSNNSATHTIIGGATNGCDSLVTLDLTINSIANSVDTRTACGSLTWIDGNTYYSSNNSATHTIIGGASNGCDSLVTLDLTINVVDASVTTNASTITANATEATYRWLGCQGSPIFFDGQTSRSFTAPSSGSYAVEVTKNGCTVTSDCIDMTIPILGLEGDTILDNDLVIYPSLTEEVVNINSGHTQILFASVFNLVGELIYQEENIATPTHQVIIQGSPGVYLLEVLTAQNKKWQFRIVKK